MLKRVRFSHVGTVELAFAEIAGQFGNGEMPLDKVVGELHNLSRAEQCWA